MRVFNWFKDEGIRLRVSKVCDLLLYLTSGVLYGLLIGDYLDRSAINDDHIILGLSLFLSLLLAIHILGGRGE